MHGNDKQRSTSLPAAPFTKRELGHFAEHNLRIYSHGRIYQKDLPQDLIDDFARLIGELPAAHQILLVSVHAPSIVTRSHNDMKQISNEWGHEKDFVPLGMFRQQSNPDNPHEHYSIVWGGMFETGVSKNDDESPDKTVRHELGHLIDTLLGSEVVAIALREPCSTKFFSTADWWHRSVSKQLDSVRSVFKTGNNSPTYFVDEHLYKGVRSLPGHLQLYNANEFTKEAFAEMTTHYTMLYKEYSGDEAEINKQLLKAYPILWPSYRDNVLPAIESIALMMWDNLKLGKESALKLAAEIATLRGDVLDSWRYSRELDYKVLEGGLNSLEATCRKAREYFEYYKYPVKSYELIVNQVDAERSKISHKRKTCMRPEWRGLDYDDTYLSLMKKGINIIQEIELLQTEQNQLWPFQRALDALKGSPLWHKDDGRRWILEDFDFIKEHFTGRNPEGIEALKRIIAVPSYFLQAYANAVQSHETIVRCSVGEPLKSKITNAERKVFRTDMYRTLVTGDAKDLRTEIKRKEMLGKAEHRYVEAVTGLDEFHPSTPEEKYARQTFRDFVQQNGVEKALELAEATFAASVERIVVVQSMHYGRITELNIKQK